MFFVGRLKPFVFGLLIVDDLCCVRGVPLDVSDVAVNRTFDRKPHPSLVWFFLTGGWHLIRMAASGSASRVHFLLLTNTNKIVVVSPLASTNRLLQRAASSEVTKFDDVLQCQSPRPHPTSTTRCCLLPYCLLAGPLLPRKLPTPVSTISLPTLSSPMPSTRAAHVVSCWRSP